MSGLRHRREDYDDRDRGRDRGRYRERRSRSRDRQFKHRRSNSRSPTQNHSFNRHHQSAKRDNRNSRYSGRRHSVSRSRSRSNSRSNSRSYSRTQKRSRTPTSSNKVSRRSCSTEHNVPDNQYQKSKEEDKAQRIESPAGKGTDEHSSNTSSIEDLPLPPKKEPVGAYYNLSTEEPIDKEKIHREIEEKLRAALAKEGKVYPPPKPEASHPVFANDGSFIEIFKKMQQAQQQQAPITGALATTFSPAEAASTSTAAAYVAATAVGKPAPPPPIVGRRRGGKILKTGLVAKPKAQGDDSGDPKDFWSIYLREVNKYKNNACESDGGTRPLVK